jgi:hypothetical protein
MTSQLKNRMVVLFFFIAVIVCHSSNLLAMSKGYEYHSNVRKAKSFDLFKKNNDSIFYYYKQARKNEIFFVDDHLWFFRTSILTNKINTAHKLIRIGGEKGMPWRDFDMYIDLAHHTYKYYCERGDTLLHFNQNIKMSQLVSKNEFKKKFKPQEKNPKNTRFFRKIDRLDQKFSRKTNSDKDIKKLIKRDLEVYHLIYDFISSLGRVPKIEEVGYEAHEILSVCLIHMNAEQIKSLLPFLIEAINEGDYYYNEDLAYAIEINAFYSGEYIMYNQGNFEV